MKSPFRFILLVLGLAVAGYAAAYFFCTGSAYASLACPTYELRWLKKEFHLNDQQAEKIRALHAAYLPQCDAMCERIREADATLQKLTVNSSEITPEIKAALAQSQEVRAQCQQAMLQHVYAVSREMSPTDGQRFIERMSHHLNSTPAVQSHHSLHE